MEVDAIGDVRADPAGFVAAAAAAEADGYDGIGLPETRHDVFVSAALAAQATTRITVQTAIAVAFARNPMSVAVLANDLQLVSAGRFQLGLAAVAHLGRRREDGAADQTAGRTSWRARRMDGVDDDPDPVLSLGRAAGASRRPHRGMRR